MSKPTELVPVGIDLGSLHARVAIGDAPNINIISNAQGARHTLALVGTDYNADDDGRPDGKNNYIFGDAARRALARDKKPTISKDPSSMVRELVRSSSSVVEDDGASAEEASAAAASFFSHLTDLACDSSSSHPSKLRTVVSVPVASTSEEQHAVVDILERGIDEALAARQQSTNEAKPKKKKNADNSKEPLVLAVITDPAAVCVAHGLTDIDHPPGIVDLAAHKNDPSSLKHILVIDWAASGLTATHVCRTSMNSSLLTIVRHVSDTSCSGAAIVQILANHCASMFERKCRVSGVLDSKKGEYWIGQVFAYVH